MKKFVIVSALILLSLFPVLAQDEDITLEKNITTLSLLPPALTHEAAISDKGSLYFAAGLGFVFLFESVNGETDSEFIVQPFLLAQYRNYYNLAKRARQLKNTDNNSGNYLGFMTSYTFKPIAGNDSRLFAERSGVALGPMWGIQRNNVVSFGLSLGLGIFIFQEEQPTFFNGSFIETRNVSGSELTVLGSFNLGFNLSRGKG